MGSAGNKHRHYPISEFPKVICALKAVKKDNKQTKCRVVCVEQIVIERVSIPSRTNITQGRASSKSWQGDSVK